MPVKKPGRAALHGPYQAAMQSPHLAPLSLFYNVSPFRGTRAARADPHVLPNRVKMRAPVYYSLVVLVLPPPLSPGFKL